MQNEVQPGIYPSMPNEFYHGAAGISKSGLDLVTKCPALYKARYIDGQPHDETTSMRIGSAAHMLVFQPDLFTIHFAVQPENINRRTKEGKAQFADFIAENTGKTILSLDEWCEAVAIEGGVIVDQKASELIKGGVAERSYFIEDGAITRKVRPDYEVNNLLIDLKTTTDASPEAFSRTCWNYRYHVQAAYYLDTVEMSTGKRPDGFVFVAVEKGTYQVAVYVASQSMIEAGRVQYQHDLEVYRRCRQANEWPGYNNGRATEISLPKWAQR